MAIPVITLAQACPEHHRFAAGLGKCPNHDPHTAAAVSEGICPRHNIPLQPYSHSCSPQAPPGHWLWCEDCRTGYRPLPHSMTGRIMCGPEGYCRFQDRLREVVATLESYRAWSHVHASQWLAQRHPWPI